MSIAFRTSNAPTWRSWCESADVRKLSRTAGVGRTLVLLSAAWLVSAAPASAECPVLGKEWITNSAVEVVFDGTVVELKSEAWGDLATVKVHGLWKGTLPRLRLGHRYVLAINHVRPPGFATLDLVYGTVMCGGVGRDHLQQMGMLDAMGRSRPPGR